MIDMYQNGGLIPRGPSGGNYTYVMIGDPAVSFFASAYNKGIRNYDAELAFEGLRLFDLYRWKELDKAVANIENERTMYGLAYEARKFNGERDYVWPLPTAELDTNKKLVQHDLWK